MIYNKSANLTDLKTFHRVLLKPPEDSLLTFGYDQIHHFQTNRTLKYHVIHSKLVTSLYALAMPIFALLDALQFAVKSLYQFITLNHKSALYNTCNCAKSLQIFLVTVLIYIPSVIAPHHILKDERFWIAQQKAETVKRAENSGVFHNLDKETNAFQRVLEEQVKEFVLENNTRNLCNKCIKEMVDSLPKDLDKAKPIASAYIRMTANLLVTSATKNINFEHKAEFLTLFKELVKVQDPEFKENLFTLMLTHQASLKDLTKPARDGDSLVLTFLLRLLTDSEPHVIKISELSQHNYFINVHHQRNFLKTLLILRETRLTNDQNNHLLDNIALLFRKPQPVSNSRAKFANRAAKLKRKLKENKEKVNALTLNLQALAAEDPKRKNALRQLEDLEKSILSTEETIRTGEAADPVAVSDPTLTINRGLQNLKILLRFPSRRVIEDKINSLRLDETDSTQHQSLSDEVFLKDFFIQTFSFEESSQNLQALSELRAPEALLKFHLRLTEYRGSDREVVLKTYKEVVLSILNNTFWQSRFETKNSPHLKAIFDSRPDLIEKWTNEHPKRSKVQDLIPNSSDQFKDCEITIATDPSDIVLIGDDLKHCLNLDGRLTRVPGLLAFLADGKTHMIVAKSADKGPSLAQTVIMLMWDKAKNKPTLLLEETYFQGNDRQDYTLENASIAYAKQMAQDLEIDLIVSVYRKRDPSIDIQGKPYDGSIVSLKTASPIEYVYSLNEVVQPPYSMGQCYLAQ